MLNCDVKSGFDREIVRNDPDGSGFLIGILGILSHSNDQGLTPKSRSSPSASLEKSKVFPKYHGP